MYDSAGWLSGYNQFKIPHSHARESALRVPRIAGGILHEHRFAVREAHRTRCTRVSLSVPDSLTRGVLSKNMAKPLTHCSMLSNPNAVLENQIMT